MTNWLIAFAVLSVIGGIGGGLIYLVQQAKQSGRLEVEKDLAERKASRAEKIAKIQAKPDRSWSDLVERLRERADDE